MAKRTLYPLYAQEDEASVRPILEGLKQKGFAIAPEGRTPKNEKDAVLFFLSKHMTDASQEIDTLLRYSAQNPEILPINLDNATTPSLISNVILARNTVFADRYSTPDLCERLSGALAAKPPLIPHLWRWALAIAAVAMVAVIAFVLIRIFGGKGAEETAAEATAVPTAAPTEVPIALPDDIPPTDLNKIMEIAFVGDTYRWYTAADGKYGDYNFNHNYDFAYRYWDDEDGAHWLSKEDGHEYPLTHYDDLSWLALLPNLRCITFCAVDAEIPDLSGLLKLTHLYYCDNTIGTLEWLRGSHLHFIDEFHGSDIRDFSPLTDCKSLESASLDLVYTTEADFSGFCPPSLRVFSVGNGHFLDTVDLSGLNQCKNLVNLSIAAMPLPDDFSLNNCTRITDLWIDSLPLRNLSFLSGCTGVVNLSIDNMQLGSLDGIETLKKLRDLQIETVEISDISAVGGCTALETISLGGYAWNENLRDLSVLGTLPRLKNISVHTANISDLNFLKDLKNKNGISLRISDHGINDFSGLASIKSFADAQFNLNWRDFNNLLPFIQDATFQNLYLNQCENIDLKKLPTITGTLGIDYGDMTSLEGLGQPIGSLYLHNCPYLTSLDGLQNLQRFGKGNGTLEVEGCPRLVDWSALNGMWLREITLRGTYSIPDFTQMSARMIRFDRVDETALPDLTCLESLDPTPSYDFDLSGQQNIPDLIPLFRLHGEQIVVPPHLGDQANELVANGQYRFAEICYPNGSWQPDSSPITLLSLDELETLPKTVLNKVTDFCMAGDTIYDPTQFWIDEDWSTDPMTAYLRRYGPGESERIPIETGTLLTDLSVLQSLTGLKRLSLYLQPFETLEGVQYLESLETLDIEECFTLTDASAAFTVQSLTNLTLRDTGVTSVEGVQNLYNLRELRLDGTDIADLSPLAGMNEDVFISVALPLLTLEQFCNLPESLRSSAERVMIAGDYVFDPWNGRWWFEVDWSETPEKYYIHENGTDNRIPIETGTLTDLTTLPEMPRLLRLWVCAEPIVSAQGVERLTNLQQFELQDCYAITDISPVYDLPELNEIGLIRTSVASIDGIQNCRKLTALVLQNTAITDISPIGEIDYTYCMQVNEWDGRAPYFRLEIEGMSNVLPPEAYAALAAVPAFDYLDIDLTDYHLWIDLLKDKPILRAQMCGCSWDNEGFAAFIAQHPEIEELDVCWDEGLTDLTPVLTLSNLRYIRVSNGMRAAARSLDGTGVNLLIDY